MIGIVATACRTDKQSCRWAPTQSSLPGTSTHRIQEIVLKRNLLCVIDQPFQLTQAPMKVREGEW
jgi:hypothetical protein